MSTNLSLADYARQEDERITAEKNKFLADQNLPGFWVPEIGENRFEIQDNPPREKDFGQGTRKIFQIKNQKGELKDWAVNPKNPVYADLMRRITNGQRLYVLLRTGKELNTRYEVLDKQY